jgi:putative DNA primase/helicase
LSDRKRPEEREFERIAGAAMADDAFAKAYPAKPDHPYLIAKRSSRTTPASGPGAWSFRLWDGETLESLQYIADDGQKRFLRKARVDGLFTSFGTIEGDALGCLSGRRFRHRGNHFELTGLPTFAAMSAGNLPLAAKRIRQLFRRADDRLR